MQLSNEYSDTGREGVSSTQVLYIGRCIPEPCVFFQPQPSSPASQHRARLCGDFGCLCCSQLSGQRQREQLPDGS